MVSIRSIVSMIFYTVAIFMFSGTCTARSVVEPEIKSKMESCSTGMSELLIACLLSVVGISDVALGYWLMKRDSDEVKEGDMAFVITRKPMEFIL